MKKRQNTKSKTELFYTKDDVVKDCVKIIKENISDINDMKYLIDFSCGSNKFAEEVIKEFNDIREFSVEINILENSFHKDDIIEKDWLKIKREDVKNKFPNIKGNKTIVGFNPPFGYKGVIAKEFINHAIDIIDPEYFFLIVPYMKMWVPKNYEMILSLQLDEKKVFSSPIQLGVHFMILKKNLNQVVGKKEVKLSKTELLEDACFHMKNKFNLNKDESKNLKISLIMRTAGFYSGNQFFYFKKKSKWNKITFYEDDSYDIEKNIDIEKIHKNNLTCVWKTNKKKQVKGAWPDRKNLKNLKKTCLKISKQATIIRKKTKKNGINIREIVSILKQL